MLALVAALWFWGLNKNPPDRPNPQATFFPVPVGMSVMREKWTSGTGATTELELSLVKEVDISVIKIITGANDPQLALLETIENHWF